MRDKLLVLHSGVELYGSDRSLIQNIQTIKKIANVHITVALHKKGPLVTHLDKIVDKVEVENYGVLSRVDVKKHPISCLWNVIKGAYRLSKRVKGVDVIYINTLTVFSPYILLPFLFRKKKIINIREIARGKQRVFFSVLLRASRAKLIFNSCATRDSYLFMPIARSEVLYNFIDIPIDKFSRTEAREYLPLKNILILGRIYPPKGQHLALKAISHLKEQGMEFQVRIVGGVAPGREDYLELIKSYVQDFALGHLVTITGFQDDVSELYSWADIILVPSIYPESFGRTVIEGMGLGKLVVAADHGGPSELIENGKNGLLFKPGSLEALVDCLKYINADFKKIIEISQNARRYYTENFTQEKFQSKLVKILELDTDNLNER